MFTRGQIKRSLTIVAVIATAGFPPVAMAMPIEVGSSSAPVTPPSGVSHTSSTALGPTDASSGGYAPVGVTHTSSTVLGPTDASSGGYDFVATVEPATAQPGSSFDWGDAGIGAAGAAVLIGAGALATLSVRRRREHQLVTG